LLEDSPPAESTPAESPPADTPPADTPPADTPPADTPPPDTPSDEAFESLLAFAATGPESLYSMLQPMPLRPQTKLMQLIQANSRAIDFPRSNSRSTGTTADAATGRRRDDKGVCRRQAIDERSEVNSPRRKTGMGILLVAATHQATIKQPSKP
jgi:hypothetical protein